MNDQEVKAVNSIGIDSINIESVIKYSFYQKEIRVRFYSLYNFITFIWKIIENFCCRIGLCGTSAGYPIF